MSHVLLTHPYLLSRDPHQARLKQPYPPLGTLQVASVLTAAGHQVEWYDPTFDPGLENLFEKIRGSHATVLCIVPDDHSVQIKQCTAQVRSAIIKLLQEASRKGMRTVVSGPDASDHPELFLSEGATAVISGEVVDALKMWLEQSEDVQIEGIHGVGGRGGRTSIQRNLDNWPDPLWSMCDLTPYATMWRENHGYWELNVWTTRGCPYRCYWCAKPIWGRTVAYRSAKRVVAEIAMLRKVYGPDRLWFTDDIFAIQPSWLSDFASLIRSNPIPFRCLSRADLLRDAHYAARLAESGCVTVWMGAESGSDTVLETMGKDATVEDSRKAVMNLKSHDIKSGLFLQLGYPGETLDDVLSTVEMIRELQPDEIGVSVSYPLPGTVFYEKVSHALGDTQWQTSMANSTLHPAPFEYQFYRNAKNVLQSTHSGQQLSKRLGLFFNQPTPKHLRLIIGSLSHRLRLPIHVRRMRRSAIPNPEAIQISNNEKSDLTAFEFH